MNTMNWTPFECPACKEWGMRHAALEEKVKDLTRRVEEAEAQVGHVIWSGVLGDDKDGQINWGLYHALPRSDDSAATQRNTVTQP